jgi:hypothetical protein
MTVISPSEFPWRPQHFEIYHNYPIIGNKKDSDDLNIQHSNLQLKSYNFLLSIIETY